MAAPLGLGPRTREDTRDEPARPPPADGPAHREREVIAAFSEVTTEAITATRLEDLLALIGQKLCHLLGVIRCSVYLRHDDHRFRGAAGWCGTDGNISAAVQAQEAGIPGDAFSCEVITTRAPVLITDVPNDPRPHRPTMEHWRVRAMLGVPLVFDGEVIGLIFVDNVEQEHVYADDDISLAELFGRLAALFIRQAVLNTRLSVKAAEVARQKDTLEYLDDVHRKLTDAVLEGADIRAVVGLLSGLSGLPVVLHDEDLAVLAWAAPPGLKMTRPPTLGARARDNRLVRATLSGLSVARPSAVIDPTPASGLGRRHLVCQLIVEDRPSGYLTLVEAGRALGDLDTKLAERGATVLALQILSERRQIEAEGQARDDFLTDLLRSTHDIAQLERRGTQFGIDLSEPHVLVRLAVESGEVQVNASTVRNRVTQGLAARLLRTAEPPAISLPGAVIVLVRLDPRAGGGAANAGRTGANGGPGAGAGRGIVGSPEDLRRHVAALSGALAPRLHVRGAVISAVCRRPEDFPHAHRELRELDELSRSFGWNEGVLTVDELGMFRVVMNSGRVKEALRFAHDLVRPLRDHEGADGQLLETWRVFVAAEARVQAAAGDLGVHENTVRYRLGRIRTLTGQDPADLDTLLAARMAFQVLDLAGG